MFDVFILVAIAVAFFKIDYLAHFFLLSVSQYQLTERITVRITLNKK